MFQLVQMYEDATDVEQFRTLHRRLFRTQQECANVEALDDDDGRKRKMSAKQQQQQHARTIKLQNDGQWLQAAGAHTMVNVNAFNYATVSKASNPEPCNAVVNATQHMADVANQVASMGFHCTNTWQPTTGPIPHSMTWC